MRKDATEFRQRFQRWKNGEQVYDKGRVIPHYRTGLDGDDDTVPSDNTRVVNPRLLTAEKIVDLPTAFELARAKHEAEQIGTTPNISQQERDLGRKKYETQQWVQQKKALEQATDEMMMGVLDPRYAALGFGIGQIARAAGSVINAGKNLYKGYKISRAINKLDRPLIARGVPEITAENAASITPTQFGRIETQMMDLGDDFKTLEHWLKNVPDKDFHDAIGVPKMFFKDRYKNDEKFLKYFRQRLNKYIFDKSLTDISATPEVMLERQKLSNLFDSDWYKSHLDGMADRDAFIRSQLQAVSEVPVFSYKVPKIGIGGYYEPDPISGYGKVFIDDNIKNGGLFYSAQRSGNIGHELGHSAGSFDYIHSNKPAILEEGSYQASKPEYYGDYDETRTRFLNIAANELWEYRNPNLIFDRHIGTFPNSNYTDVLYGYDREFAKHYMQTFKSLFPYLIGGGLSIPALNNK